MRLRLSRQASETGACSTEKSSPATIALVDDDFDLLLDDGRRLSLAGLDFPQGEGEAAKLRAAALARLSTWLLGAQVFVETQRSAPDRWGRQPALIYAPATAEQGAPLVSVAAALLAEGLARFRPDPAAAVCAATYLAAEAPARREERGVFGADPVVDLTESTPGKLAALAHKKGMTVVEGVVRSVGKSRASLYLNFGTKRGADFAIVIFKRNKSIFAKNGVYPRTLAGRRVVVRGLIDWNYGPRMELFSPAELEVEDEAAGFR